jgi:hypothetical protein
MKGLFLESNLWTSGAFLFSSDLYPPTFTGLHKQMRKNKTEWTIMPESTVLIGFYVETDSSCGQSTREQEIDHWFSLHLPMLPALHQSLHRCTWQQDYIFCCLWQQSQTPCLSLKVTNISFSITTTSFYLCLRTTFDAKLSVWACE